MSRQSETGSCELVHSRRELVHSRRGLVEITRLVQVGQVVHRQSARRGERGLYPEIDAIVAVPQAANYASRRALERADFSHAGGMMGDVSGDWALRPFVGVADHDRVEALWLAALGGRWPLLPKAIATVREGLFAEEGGRTVGCVAVDLAGSIPLVLVAPGHQRRGIGAALLSAALGRLRAAGVSTVQAGSGGADNIWPGVPTDLPEAVRLFANCGWRAGQDTLDLVADLPDYRAPALASGSSAWAGITIGPAAPADAAAVMAFETATFPHWARSFRAGNRDILLARDDAGAICATLLLDGPGADTVFEPMLGRAAATINCVGVAPRARGRGIGTALVARASEILRDRGAGTCHISWTVRESFYTRAGYRPWRRYRMFRTSTGPH